MLNWDYGNIDSEYFMSNGREIFPLVVEVAMQVAEDNGVWKFRVFSHGVILADQSYPSENAAKNAAREWLKGRLEINGIKYR
jgi:hypothetical protein